MAFTDGECIQDQYGYQYTLTIDEDHQYITGTVSGGQGGRSMDSHGQLLKGTEVAGYSDRASPAQTPSGESSTQLSPWYVQSGPADPWIYELTVTNTNGIGQSGFVPMYKLKRVQPQGAWYYEFGYGDQEFTFTSCTTAAAMAEAGQEPVSPGERRGARMG